MPEQGQTFEQVKARLEDIAVQVRRKDTSLETSIELLEEGVRLANICNELVDQVHASGEGSPEEGERVLDDGAVMGRTVDDSDAGDLSSDEGDATAEAEQTQDDD